ncbi:hypothetical protein KSP39_PZI017465 [Platanthera zijinensis]|uniref:Uncharacterized protein n=1 Tax=Platanthera zijinensis TaxID=2320716 RepID=A0AAP0B4T3_9ASPA
MLNKSTCQEYSLGVLVGSARWEYSSSVFFKSTRRPSRETILTQLGLSSSKLVPKKFTQLEEIFHVPANLFSMSVEEGKT